MRSLTIYKAENGFIVSENQDVSAAVFTNPRVFERVGSYSDLAGFLSDWGARKDIIEPEENPEVAA